MAHIFDKKQAEEVAQKLLGTKFELGGRAFGISLDCYGLLIAFFKEFGIDLPDYSYIDDWAENEDQYLKRYQSLARRLADDEDLETGDILIFGKVPEVGNHAGVYLGKNRFVHCSYKIGTKINSTNDKTRKDKTWKSYIILRLRLK